MKNYLKLAIKFLEIMLSPGARLIGIGVTSTQFFSLFEMLTGINRAEPLNFPN